MRVGREAKVMQVSRWVWRQGKSAGDIWWAGGKWQVWDNEGEKKTRTGGDKQEMKTEAEGN